MPEFHSEPYIYLPSVSHKSVLVAWGAFYFRVTTRGASKLVDDDDLKYVHPPRKDSIGARSAPYGPARVEVYDAAGRLAASAETEAVNHCWVTGLAPDTDYTYKVFVKDEEWARDERWDWSASARALVQSGGRYDNRFRTHPDPTAAARRLTFAVIGDFGVGVRKVSEVRRQQQVADALRHAVETEDVRLVLTTGDNIYAGKTFFGLPIGSTGEEDDDWFFTFFQPYRYFINRIPIYPSIGNHDTAESEDNDDRGQVEDNFYLAQRISGEEAAGRASFGPGLFYRFRYGSDIEFVCIDTSKESVLGGRRLFEFPRHWTFLEEAFPASALDETMWRIPFGHHPPYSAGPRHHNTKTMSRLLPLFSRAGVKAVFSGHEHNFQHSRADGIDYFVTGAAGKFRGGTPDEFASAHTQSWSAECHFLLGRIDGDRMMIRAIAERGDAGSGLVEITRADPAGRPVTGAIEVRR